MGNLANPLVNRWGLNLFWYNFWFKDKKYNLNLHVNLVLENIIKIYLNYGFFFSKNIFISKYWYEKKYFSENFLNLHYNKYFKLINFKNKILNIDSFFYKRNELKNIFFGKIWILTFQNFIIINVYSFKPQIKSQKNSLRKKTNRFLFIIFLIWNLWNMPGWSYFFLKQIY